MAASADSDNRFATCAPVWSTCAALARLVVRASSASASGAIAAETELVLPAAWTGDRNADNAKRARRCLALLLFAQGCVVFKERRSGQARAYFAEAIELRQGLNDDRRNRASFITRMQSTRWQRTVEGSRFGEAQALET